MKANQSYFENVDIRDYPLKDPQFAITDITIGDLHANPLLLMHILTRQGIIDVPPDTWKQFVDLYTQWDLQPSVNRGWDAPILFGKDAKTKLQKVNEQYKNCLSQVKVIDKKKLVRLLGDDVVDRGVNDYFVLKLYEHLQKEGANFEILLSNHGVEFVEACEKFKENGKKLIAARIHNIEHGNSFHMLQKSIDLGVITHEEALYLYNKVYRKHLTLLSYSLDSEANEIRVYSHAGIGLNHIRGMATKFSVPYKAGSAAELAKTIDAINTKFTEKVNAKEVHTLYTDRMMQSGYEGFYVLGSEAHEVIASALWNRSYWGLEREAAEFKVTFIHGHDSRDFETNKHITLNEPLGQFETYSGTLRTYQTDGKHKVSAPVRPEPRIKSLLCPSSYNQLWTQKDTFSDVDKAKMLLKDYTKDDSILGSSFGLFFTGHWNRHHVAQVQKILQAEYEFVDDLIVALKAINPRKGGSLDRRIRFIEAQVLDTDFSLKAAAAAA